MKTSLLFLAISSSLTFALPVDLGQRGELEERGAEPWYEYDTRGIDPWHEYEAREISPWEDFESLSSRGVSADKMFGSSRDGGAGARLGQGMFEIIDKFQTDDDKRRTDFVHNSLDKYGKQHPGYNIIVVHTDVGYDKDFGKDWGKAHEEVPIHIGGRSKGYDIFWFKKGTFNRHGDGGWLNWGYTGSPKRDGGKLTYT